MTLKIRHNIFKKVIFSFIVLSTLIVSSLLQSCSENDYPADDKAVVVLLCKSISSDIQTKQNNNITRAITSATEDYVQDLTVYIFNSNGDVIGSNYSSYSIASNTSITMNITTRAAKGCSIYVVANASSGKFTGIYNKTMFDNQYATITNPDNLASGSTYPIMFGKAVGVDINVGTNSKSISVARLLSKITFNIVPKNATSAYPITIGGYQLHNVPLNCYYSDVLTTPFSSYGDFGAVTPTANNTDGSTLSFTYYVYQNLAGTNSASTTWKLRNKTTAPSKASYLTVDASTAIWKSRFYIYLGGKVLTSAGASPTYDYSDYNIYRNTNYTVTVNINGSGANEDDVRVDYDAKIYFNSPGINPWTNNPIDVSM